MRSRSSLRRRVPLAAAVVGSLTLGACAPTPDSAPTTTAVSPDSVPFVYPLARRVPLSDTFGAARSGGRSHEGQDLMAPKMTVAVAVVSGTITQVRHSNTGNAGNQLRLSGDDGWTYYYIHLNNDTPGTDDGANRYDQAFVDGIRVGQRVLAGEPIGFVGDSGNAESTGSHLHFEARDPSGAVTNPFERIQAAPVSIRDTSQTRPVGVLDSAVQSGPNAFTVRGWALPASGDDAVPLSVYVNGNPFASSTASLPRPDIALAYPGRGAQHGFELSVGGIVTGTHEVCVVFHNPTAGGGSRTQCSLVPIG